VHSVHSVVKESFDHKKHGIHGMKMSFGVPESARYRPIRAFRAIRG
jgi:hypothetical protein